MNIQQNICNTIENAKNIVVKIIGIKRNHFKKKFAMSYGHWILFQRKLYINQLSCY